MPVGTPKSLTECQRFFLEPHHRKQRLYEALRAYFVQGRPAHEVARAFGYTPGSFRVLCQQFRRDAQPEFFVSSPPGPRTQPKKSAARRLIEHLRQQNYAVYDISATLKAQHRPLSPTAVREVRKELGFAPRPRRLDEERPERPRPTIEPVADVRPFSLAPRSFPTRCGGLLLFVPALVRLDIDSVAHAAQLPGAQRMPAGHALRAALALQLCASERKSHVMALVADEGVGLVCGLHRLPNKRYLSAYSARLDHTKPTKLLAGWHAQVPGEGLFRGHSCALDCHSVPYYGAHPVRERHDVSARSHRQPSGLMFLAQDAEGRACCYSHADMRQGEEADEVLRCIAFWPRVRGEPPQHLGVDARLTTSKNVARLDAMGITFITVRRRSPSMLREIAALPRSAWRQVQLEVPTRKSRTPRVYEKTVQLAGRSWRHLYGLDLGHDEPTVWLSNEGRTAVQLITRDAQRMLIENALADAVRFFHMEALSSAVGLKVDCDMALLVIASGRYRLLAASMRGDSDSQARQIFRDLSDMPADVHITASEVAVRFHRRAHLPLILAAGLLDKAWAVPWWHGRPLRMTTEKSSWTWPDVRGSPSRGNPG